MGRTGVCWDNAQIESFWSTLKHKYYNRHSFATKHEARHGVGRWIDEIYNRRRRHSSIGMISPIAFEKLNPRRHKPPKPVFTNWGQPHHG